MLTVKNLCKSFDGVRAVQDFSLTLKPQKITSLIGPNGAGKSTVFNIVTGFLLADSGSVLYKGSALSSKVPWRITRKGVSRTFQNLRLFNGLTVLENVLIGRQNQSGERFLNALILFSGNSPEHKRNVESAEALLEFVDLANHRNELAENLSYGQQKLLSIACCLATEPNLLLFDEPVSGVQPAMVEKIASIMKQLVEQEKKTVLLIEHDIDFVLKISDIVVVMDEGKKIAEEFPTVIGNNPEILDAYLS